MGPGHGALAHGQPHARCPQMRACLRLPTPHVWQPCRHPPVGFWQRNIKRSRRSLKVCALYAPEVPFPIRIQGRHAPLTPALEDLASAKVARALEHYRGAVREAEVTLDVGGRGPPAHHRRVQTAAITVHTLGHGTVHVDETDADLHAALALATSKLKRAMERLKGKALRQGSWRPSAEDAVSYDLQGPSEPVANPEDT